MNKTKQHQQLQYLRSSARLAQYDVANNGSNEDLALSKVAALMPAPYSQAVDELKALAGNNSANSRRQLYSAALLKQLKAITAQQRGSAQAVVVAYFQQLSQAHTLMQAFWSGLRSVFSYCFAVTLVAVVVLVIVGTKVLPQMQHMFSATGDKMPAFTQFVMTLAHYSTWIVGGVILLTVLLFALVQGIKRRILALLPLPPWLARVPAFSGLCYSYHYCLYLQYLDIIEQAGGTGGDAKLHEALWQLAFGQAPQPQVGTTTHMLRCTLAAANELGAQRSELDHQRNIIADHVLEQLMITRAAIWAVMLALLGILVGGVVIAVYLPIFALGSIV